MAQGGRGQDQRPGTGGIERGPRLKDADGAVAGIAAAEVAERSADIDVGPYAAVAQRTGMPESASFTTSVMPECRLGDWSKVVVAAGDRKLAGPDLDEVEIQCAVVGHLQVHDHIARPEPG